MSVKDKIKNILFLKVQNIAPKQIQKTINIVKVDAVGDFILFTQILPYFKKIYPGYKIVLIGNSLWQELAQWIKKEKILGDDFNDYFDELLPINLDRFRFNLFYYYKIIKSIRMAAAEIALQTTFSRSEESDHLVFISKEAFKIGYNGDFSHLKKQQKDINDKKYDRLIENPNLSLETEKNKYFLTKLAGKNFSLLDGPSWQLSQKILSEGRILLEFFVVDLLRPILVICPGAGENKRQWPAENYTLLLLKLFKYNPSLQFILIGSAKEKGICDKIEKEAKKNNLSIYNLCKIIKLPEIAKILAVSNLYIGNETGPLHMALAINIPTVAIVGGGHYNRFPIWKTGEKNIAAINKMDCFDCDWKCIYKIKKNEPAPCIQKIKVDDIYAKTIKILEI